MRHLLIDADTGIDDSIAILYALSSPRLRVEGITTCFGNSGARQSAENCLRLIRLSNCGYDVPVVVGADCRLDGTKKEPSTAIHGENGIGDVILPPSGQKPLELDAADFIVQKATELEGELVLVTTGSLTNLARALEKDPTLPRKLKRLVVMGGCLQVPGNVTPVAEANLHADPQASDRVFRAGFPMLLVGLDVTTETFIRSADLEALEPVCSDKSRAAVAYMRQALDFYFRFHRQTQGMLGQCFVHDPLAVLIAEDATLGEYKMIRAGVEYERPEYQGMILRDDRFLSTMDHDEIAACIRVDARRAIRRLFSVFC